jgi:hypothetical protein
MDSRSHNLSLAYRVFGAADEVFFLLRNQGDCSSRNLLQKITQGSDPLEASAGDRICFVILSIFTLGIYALSSWVAYKRDLRCLGESVVSISSSKQDSSVTSNSLVAIYRALVKARDAEKVGATEQLATEVFERDVAELRGLIGKLNLTNEYTEYGEDNLVSLLAIAATNRLCVDSVMLDVSWKGDATESLSALCGALDAAGIDASVLQFTAKPTNPDMNAWDAFAAKFSEFATHLKDMYYFKTIQPVVCNFASQMLSVKLDAEANKCARATRLGAASSAFKKLNIEPVNEFTSEAADLCDQIIAYAAVYCNEVHPADIGWDESAKKTLEKFSTFIAATNENFKTLKFTKDDLQESDWNAFVNVFTVASNTYSHLRTCEDARRVFSRIWGKMLTLTFDEWRKIMGMDVKERRLAMINLGANPKK